MCYLIRRLSRRALLAMRHLPGTVVGRHIILGGSQNPNGTEHLRDVKTIVYPSGRFCVVAQKIDVARKVILIPAAGPDHASDDSLGPPETTNRR
jgi:hypothetical protein